MEEEYQYQNPEASSSATVDYDPEEGQPLQAAPSPVQVPRAGGSRRGRQIPVNTVVQLTNADPPASYPAPKTERDRESSRRNDAAMRTTSGLNQPKQNTIDAITRCIRGATSNGYLPSVQPMAAKAVEQLRQETKQADYGDLFAGLAFFVGAAVVGYGLYKASSYFLSSQAAVADVAAKASSSAAVL